MEPARCDTDGPDACELSSAYGLTMDEWQARVLAAWLGRDIRDRFCASSCGLSLPRQNGKNAVIEVRELYGMAVIGERMLHTAHRVDTARKSFLRLASFFESPANADLAEMVTCIRRTNGQESITLSNGGSIEFSSRVNGGARGSTYDVVVFDEAQELTDDQMEAILSTMAAAPLGNRQLIYTGTPPSPVSPGTVFRRVREESLSGDDPSASWHEWGVEEIGDVSDRSRWYEANPALGYRLDEDFTERELRTLTPAGFARERLGWWGGDHATSAVVSGADWEACGTGDPPAPHEGEVVCYAAKFSPDGAVGVICAAARQEDGRVLVEVPAGCDRSMSGGAAWFADWLAARSERAAQVVVDGRAHAGNVVEKLRERGVPRRVIWTPSSADVATACSMFADAARGDGAGEGREVVHSRQPALTRSVTHATKRKIGSGGGWGFEGIGEADATAAEAAALAFWAAKTTRRRPGGGDVCIVSRA